MPLLRQFSLKSVFISVFWLAVTLGLLRLIPLVTPARLVDMFSIDDSQQAPFLLLVPAALLVAAAAACGAGCGVLVNAGGRGAMRFATFGIVTVLIYFVVLAWTIWTDHFLTIVYTAVVAVVCWRMIRKTRGAR